MILAAGRATRLGALGREQAKALIEFDGRPLLEHHLRYLARHGVSKVVVNASHLAAQIEAFAEGFEGPPSVRVSLEPEPLGTAGGVIRALPEFDGAPLLVLYGDVVIDEDLVPMGAVHERHRPVATLAVFHSEEVEGKGIVELSEDRVTGFREKDPGASAGWVNAGAYIVDPGWLGGFEAEPKPDFGHDLFPAALAAGSELCAHRLASPVLDIGTPEDLARGRARGLPDSTAG